VKKPFIIAGIPAHNEEKTIAKVILLTKQYVDEIIVVDDGSVDMTGEIAEALGAKVIRFSENLGKGAAVRAIIEYARKLKPDVLVLLDADLQHDPHEIPKLIEPILNGEADLVIGSRFLGKSKIPLIRGIGLKVLTVLAKQGTNITDPLSGFRALSRKVYETLELSESGYGIEVDMLADAAKKGYKIKEVPIIIRYDTGTKTSKRSAPSQFGEILSAILRRTIYKRPLLYLGVPGFIFLVMGIALAVWLIEIFNRTRYFSIPLSFAAFFLIIVGMLMTMNALVIVRTNDVRREMEILRSIIITHSSEK